jgi:hypothetical protein
MIFTTAWPTARSDCPAGRSVELGPGHLVKSNRREASPEVTVGRPESLHDRIKTTGQLADAEPQDPDELTGPPTKSLHQAEG